MRELRPQRRSGQACFLAALVASTLAGIPFSATPASAAVTPCPAPVIAGTTATVTCSYTGDAQTWTVPTGVTSATFDVYGAAGGTPQAPQAGGLGGRSVATLTVTPGTVLHVVVGGAGGRNGGGLADAPIGGFNGGGNGGAICDVVCFWGAGGGGASDVRSGGAALANRVVVAGGGGGAGSFSEANGGSGGGTTGGNGDPAGSGIGGNQNGTAGSGVAGSGSSSTWTGGGGGGGYYGGGAAPDASGPGAGGGGSGFTLDGAGMTNGVRAGDGIIVITYQTVPEVSSIATQATPTVTLGSPISDTATVTGAPASPPPTGTVVFTLFGPNDAACATPIFISGAQTLSGGPPPTANSGAFTPTVPGTYRWRAAYSGDPNYGAVTGACNDANETSVVTQASATMATQATPTVTIGSPISDTATVTGAPASPPPTGAVVFTLFGPNDAACATPIFISGAQPLSGGPPPTANSGPFTPTVPGTYRWRAAYSGDSNYGAVTGACNDANETSVVTQASPTIATQASSGGPLGTAISDTATVSGGSNPTGTVTFRLFSDAACATQVFTSTNGLTGSTATSGTFTPASAGTYYWTAFYSGDANNNPATGPCGAPNESVTITRSSPTISTQASVGGIVGTAVNDTATLAGGSSPTGTVTFRLFSNATCTTQVFTSANPVGGGSATSDSFTPATAGTYYWTAAYGGDVNNNPATGPCNAPNESVTIAKRSPTISTQATPGGPLDTTVRDVATLGNTVGPTGSVTFGLFSDASCTNQVFTSTNPVGGGTATSGNFTPANVGTYYWTAAYSGDANNNPATGPCNAPNESVTITMPLCDGLAATMLGTAGDDRLVGTPGNDVIVGRGGHDTIYGGGGNDRICADAGLDRVFGEDGDDRLFGGADADLIEGGNGNDALFGDGAEDRLMGGPGNDALTGGTEYDRCFGDDGTADTATTCEVITGVP